MSNIDQATIAKMEKSLTTKTQQFLEVKAKENGLDPDTMTAQQLQELMMKYESDPELKKMDEDILGSLFDKILK